MHSVLTVVLALKEWFWILPLIIRDAEPMRSCRGNRNSGSPQSELANAAARDEKPIRRYKRDIATGSSSAGGAKVKRYVEVLRLYSAGCVGGRTRHIARDDQGLGVC